MTAILPLALAGVVEIVPDIRGDERGFFSETWSTRAMQAMGMTSAFVQDNHVHSRQRGVLRGLHYQLPPYAQTKLVRVVHGAIYDVAVDVRRSSPDLGKWIGRIVSAELWNQVLVPAGFAHGYVTLEPETTVLYKVSRPYSPAHERAIRFDDPDLGIDWPIDPGELLLSDKDRRATSFAAAELFD